MTNTASKEAASPGPVAIGGVGGSGTRIVAEILIQLGFYLGNDLNPANDNLLFTLIFKRPRWFAAADKKRKTEIFKALTFFEAAMTGNMTLRPADISSLLLTAVKMAVTGHDHLHSGNGFWPFKRIIGLKNVQGRDLSKYTGWGWKEPNTHIYLEYLCRHFSSLKYIHVVRHGLDMAYSKNQAQMYNWGWMFGVDTPDSDALLPKAALKYWIAANNKTITLGRTLLGDRFYLLNMDELCGYPEKGIQSLMNFLNVDTNNVNMEALKSLPRTPSSAGRYKQYDLNWVGAEEMSELKNLGFGVESRNGSFISSGMRASV